MFGGGGGNNDDAEMDDLEGGNQEKAGILGNAMGSAMGYVNAAGTQLSSLAPPDPANMQTAMVAIGAGVLLWMLALMFLPMVVLAPHKFALLSSLGSCCLLFAGMTLRGLSAFLEFLTAAERRKYTAGFVISLVGVLYSSLVSKSYFLTIICCSVEMICLVYILLSYVPGGAYFLDMVGGVLCGGCRAILSRFFTREAGWNF